MKTIGTGRYLCLLYYRGELKPSCFYAEQSAEWLLSRCVETPLQRSGNLAEYWRLLMSGDLSRQSARAHSKLTRRAAGGRANFTGVSWKGEPIENCVSLDGRDVDGLTLGEIALYQAVGEEFVRLLQ